jgi:uncharacterized membrane protein YphA (DoxX/SURF4 family)
MRVIGRVFLSIIFIIFGVSAILNWDVAYTDLDSAIVNWQMYKGNFEAVGSFLDMVTGYIPFLLGLGIFLQIVGGLMVCFGYKVKIGAFFLGLYMIGATLVYYPFWFYEGEQMTYNLVLFLKNISIFGGVLLLFGGKSKATTYAMLDDDM